MSSKEKSLSRRYFYCLIGLLITFQAAKRVGIKYSTAKTIYAIYLREGRVTTKLGRNMKSANSENTEMKKSKTKTPKKRRVPKKSEESVSFEKGEMFTTRPETRAASKNSQSAKSNLICKIKELQPPAHEEAPCLVKSNFEPIDFGKK